MMRFKFDGNLIDPPKNWEEVDTTIKRDNQLNLFLLYQEYNLEFADTGFDYLYDISINQNFCTQVVVTIEIECNQQWNLIFRGIIFLSDCEFNERGCSVNCKVSDDSFFSKINNNKNIKTSLEGLYTKNRSNITVAANYDLNVIDILNGTTVVRTVQSCRIFEAFRYFIDFMTDNSISFISNSFDIGGTWEGLCITTGERLRGVVPSGSIARWQQFSFLELFTEVNKRIPIILLIENPYTNPAVRIETLDYLYNNTITFTADNIYEIVTSFDNEKLYALVKFGSPVDDTFSDFPESIDYFGYKEEEFHILGNCNLDQALDLTADWVVSTNVMQRCVSFGSQDYDDDIFLIESTPTTAILGDTFNSNFLNVTPARYYYNPNLNNQNISIRYLSDISNSIANYYIDSNDGEALAYLNTNILNSFVPADNQAFLVNEAYDFGNYYDTVLARYVTPVNGVFTFTSKITLQLGAISNPFAVPNPYNWYQVWLEHYNASNVIINRYEYYTPNQILPAGTIPPGGIFDRIFEYVGAVNSTYAFNLPNTAVSMNPGDYVTVRFRSYPYTYPILGFFIAGQEYTILNGQNNTYLQCVDNSNVGAVFLDVEPDDFKVQLHRFNYPMSQSEFDVILANPTGRIQFAMEGQQPRFGWIKQMKYNHTTATAEFVLTTSKATQNGGS